MIIKKRILHVITYLDPSASTTHTLETAARIDRSCYEMDLVSGVTVDPLKEVSGFMARKDISCRYLASLRGQIHPWLDLIAFIALVGMMRRGKYDIVHTHLFKAGLLGRWAARCAGIKHVVHSPHGHVFYRYSSKQRVGFFALLERWSARITDRLVALTFKSVKEHLKFGVGTSSQWAVIPSGIDLARFSYVAEDGLRIRRGLGIDQDDLVFVSVARLEPVKGVVYLLEAMAEIASLYPAAKLIVVGDGSERDMLSLKAKDLGIAGNVYFVGTQRDVPAFLSAGDVFLSGSLNEEMGRAVVEAMASGLPSVISRTGGLSECIEDGKEGFLVEPGNSRSFATAMRKLLSDKNLRKTMSNNARCKADMKFSAKIMVASLEMLYKELAS